MWEQLEAVCQHCTLISKAFEVVSVAKQHYQRCNHVKHCSVWYIIGWLWWLRRLLFWLELFDYWK